MALELLAEARVFNQRLPGLLLSEAVPIVGLARVLRLGHDLVYRAPHHLLRAVELAPVFIDPRPRIAILKPAACKFTRLPLYVIIVFDGQLSELNNLY